MNRAGVPGSVEVVRIRAPRRLTAIRFGCLVLVAVVYAALYLHPATRSDTPAPTEEVFLCSVYVLLVVRCVLRLFRPRGVDLGPDRIVVQGLLRGNAVAWRDVAAVRGHRSGIFLDRTDGRPIRLEYPGGDSAERRLIQEWWLHHRG